MELTKAQINELRGLRHKRNREASLHFVVEGPKVISELLAADHQFISVYHTPDWKPDAAASNLIEIPWDTMTRISHYPTPSPVLAVGWMRRDTLEAGELDQGRTLALDGIQDPGNVGTLIRIADWFGFDRVLLSPECADLFSQKVINASMGSFARMRIITTDLPSALTSTSAPILGCALTGENVHDLQPLDTAIVVIGSEGRGLTPAVAATLTRTITIPRLGHAESLNAAVAAGIVCSLLSKT